MIKERCYRLADRRETVEVRGDAARDALVAHGYGLVAEIDCTTGTVTVQADPEYVEQGERERAAFDELDEAEKRQLRRQVGGVLIEQPGQLTSWGAAKAKED
jgi:hypothetical protein